MGKEKTYITPWGYFVYHLLYSIPIIGLIFMIIHSLDNTNVNRRNFSRFYLYSFIFGFIILFIVFILSMGNLSSTSIVS